MADQDQLLRTLSGDGSVAVRVLSATQLVGEAARRHATPAMATVVLGRALMGALLLATETQDGERVQLQIRGDGPLGRVTVTADSEGDVRGYVANAAGHVSPRGHTSDAGGAVASAVGLGSLSVERNHPSWKQPYHGIVPLVAGTIAQDIALYLAESEQKHSAVALGVQLGLEAGADARVESAGGYLIQALPGADDVLLAEVEKRVAELENPSALLREGATAQDLADYLLAGLGMGPVDTLVPRFLCTCSQDRIRRAVLLLGRAELEAVVAAEEPLEVRCEFCAERYVLAPSVVARLLADA